jgi:hypothetical protein
VLLFRILASLHALSLRVLFRQPLPLLFLLFQGELYLSPLSLPGALPRGLYAPVLWQRVLPGGPCRGLLCQPGVWLRVRLLLQPLPSLRRLALPDEPSLWRRALPVSLFRLRREIFRGLLCQPGALLRGLYVPLLVLLLSRLLPVLLPGGLLRALLRGLYAPVLWQRALPGGPCRGILSLPGVWLRVRLLLQPLPSLR